MHWKQAPLLQASSGHLCLHLHTHTSACSLNVEHAHNSARSPKVSMHTTLQASAPGAPRSAGRRTGIGVLRAPACWPVSRPGAGTAGGGRRTRPGDRHERRDQFSIEERDGKVNGCTVERSEWVPRKSKEEGHAQAAGVVSVSTAPVVFTSSQCGHCRGTAR